jgi:hypothetical protein
MKSRGALAAVMSLSFAVTSLWAKAVGPVAVRAGRLFDSRTGRLLTRQVVLIQDGQVAEAGPADSVNVPPRR